MIKSACLSRAARVFCVHIDHKVHRVFVSPAQNGHTVFCQMTCRVLQNWTDTTSDMLCLSNVTPDMGYFLFFCKYLLF